MVQQQVHFTSDASLIQILPSGHMPQTEDLVIQDIPENIGHIFIFNTANPALFKIEHTYSEAVATISSVTCMINYVRKISHS